MKLVENLDPSAFWKTYDGRTLWEDGSVPLVHKLIQWNDFLDDYMSYHGTYTQNFTRRTTFRLPSHAESDEVWQANRLYYEIWGAFPEAILEEARNEYLAPTTKPAGSTNELERLLKAVIRAKVIALLSHRLLAGYPLDEASADFWPLYPVPEDISDGQVFQNAIYTRYFISRALALVLRRDTIDYVFFQFVGTEVQGELNTNAHTSGIDPSSERETRQLLDSAGQILDNGLTVKEKVPTFLDIFNIVTTQAITTNQRPLDRGMIINAVSPD